MVIIPSHITHTPLARVRRTLLLFRKSIVQKRKAQQAQLPRIHPNKRSRRVDYFGKVVGLNYAFLQADSTNLVVYVVEALFDLTKSLQFD